MTIPFEKLKARLLANPKVKAEYDALTPEFEISAELLRARLRAGLSQAELAARMRTSQSAIARLESGQTLPSTKTLLRYAEATGSKFIGGLSLYFARRGLKSRKVVNWRATADEDGQYFSPWRYDATLTNAENTSAPAIGPPIAVRPRTTAAPRLARDGCQPPIYQP
jgi:transcriptional regulator with XRE-family HTH domain